MSSSKFSLKGLSSSKRSAAAAHVKEVMTIKGSGVQALSFSERSLLFARISSAAYLDQEEEVREKLLDCGFTFFKLVTEADGSGAECWIVASPTGWFDTLFIT